MNSEHLDAYIESLFNQMAELDSELRSLDEDNGGPGSEERFRLQTEINRLEREVNELTPEVICTVCKGFGGALKPCPKCGK